MNTYLKQVKRQIENILINSFFISLVHIETHLFTLTHLSLLS